MQFLIVVIACGIFGDIAAEHVFNTIIPKDAEFANHALRNAIPGVDYPIYAGIPKTNFSCNEKPDFSYHADIITRCQVFHRCSNDGTFSSYLCSNLTVFNQETLVCDYFFNVECGKQIIHPAQTKTALPNPPVPNKPASKATSIPTLASIPLVPDLILGPKARDFFPFTTPEPTERPVTPKPSSTLSTQTTSSASVSSSNATNTSEVKNELFVPSARDFMPFTNPVAIQGSSIPKITLTSSSTGVKSSMSSTMASTTTMLQISPASSTLTSTSLGQRISSTPIVTNSITFSSQVSNNKTLLLPENVFLTSGPLLTSSVKTSVNKSATAITSAMFQGSSTTMVPGLLSMRSRLHVLNATTPKRPTLQHTREVPTPNTRNESGGQQLVHTEPSNTSKTMTARSVVQVNQTFQSGFLKNLRKLPLSAIRFENFVIPQKQLDNTDQTTSGRQLAAATLRPQVVPARFSSSTKNVPIKALRKQITKMPAKQRKPGPKKGTRNATFIIKKGGTLNRAPANKIRRKGSSATGNEKNLAKNASKISENTWSSKPILLQATTAPIRSSTGTGSIS